MSRIIKDVKQKWSDTKRKGLSLGFRVLGTFFILLMTLLLAIFIIFSAMGTFNINKTKAAVLIDHELTGVSGQIKSEFTTVTSRSISLSENLSIALKQRFAEHSMEPSELSEHPEVLNDLLSDLFPIIYGELKSIKASGIFLIFDATINKDLPNADISKAGLFIKNITAQNNIFTSHNDIRYLYGPMYIAQNFGMAVLPQWQLQFDVSEMSLYQVPMKAALEHPDATLSQLYYWTGKASDGGSDYGTYCSVPIIIDGSVIGVCGFEISSMQFKLAYAPEIEDQSYSCCMLVPSDGANLFFDRAMFSGNYAVTSTQPYGTIPIPSGDGFLPFTFDNISPFYGKIAKVPFYGSSSCYTDETFYTVILTPKTEIEKLTKNSTLRFLFAFSLIFFAGVALSVVLYIRNIKPVKDALRELKRNKKKPDTKVHIPEIDDLFDFLEEKDQEYTAEVERLQLEKAEAEKQNEEALSAVKKSIRGYDINDIDPELYEAFVRNLKELTNRERDIFDLYIQGKKAKDIEEICHISENTMKFHNRNIYDKLCVSSRKQLVLYASHMAAVMAEQKEN